MLGTVGAGEVIYNSGGQKVVDFSRGLGKNTNNIEETLTVYMGLKIAHAQSIWTLVVLGDSEIVIKNLLGLSSFTAQSSNGLYSRINTLNQLFIKIHFLHILCSQNTEEDHLAKVVKSLEQSHLVSNQILSYDCLP